MCILNLNLVYNIKGLTGFGLCFCLSVYIPLLDYSSVIASFIMLFFSLSISFLPVAYLEVHI